MHLRMGALSVSRLCPARRARIRAPRDCGSSSSLAAFSWPCASAPGPKASLIPSSEAFLFTAFWKAYRTPAQNSWMRVTAASNSALDAA
jgi:hypothetical protein